MKCLLENSKINIFILIIGCLICLVAGVKFASSFFVIIYFGMGTLILKNSNFYEKVVRLANKYDYTEYLGKDEMSKVTKRRRTAINYYFFSVIFLLYMFNLNYVNFNSLSLNDLKLIRLKIFKIIFILVLALVNSIIGLYLYRKFKNNKQYVISSSIYIILLIYTIYLL